MMEPPTGLTSSSINLRSDPDLKSHIIDALGPQEHIQVLAEAGDMVKVQTTQWQPPVTGYILKSAVVENKPVQNVFPEIRVKDGIEIPSVPISLPLDAFLKWYDSGDESPWLPANFLKAIQAGQQPSVGNRIRQVILDRQMEWATWVDEVKSQGRGVEATLEEWLVILAGGRQMWSLRTERIFSEPSQSAAAPAWVDPKDILLWTGHVRLNNQETKYKTWYEVQLTKLDREFKGWYKASLLQEFIPPTPETDLSIPGNKDKVFDLSKPRLRLPADPEIEESQKAGRRASQYIDVKSALGWAQVNYNLCGEFCAAALVGSDVLPLLKQWVTGSDRAKGLLEKDYGTGLPDLEAMLGPFTKSYEEFRAESSVAPLTPAYLRKMLDTGRMAIVGVGVTTQGIIQWSSGIRHWVVIEDILRVGSSGWVRLYNPYFNREEVYPFEAVFDSVSRAGVGLWVTPAPVGDSIPLTPASDSIPRIPGPVFQPSSPQP